MRGRSDASQQRHQVQMDKEQSMRVLIIEDEPVLALTLEDLLLDAGFVVVGIAGKLQKALDLIGSAKFDVAIIDANLGGTSASPAASALTAKGLPFIVVSGYSAEQLRPAFPNAVVMMKPYQPDQLIRALKDITHRV